MDRPKRLLALDGGGMSSYNNPAFQLFVEATHPDYGIGWMPPAKKICC